MSVTISDELIITDESATPVQTLRLRPDGIIHNDVRKHLVENGLEYITPFNGDTETLQEKINELVARVNEITGA